MPRCEVHGDRNAVGYCYGCGTFGCAECLIATDAAGNQFCQVCAEAKGIPLPVQPVRADHVHSLHVVRFKDGRRLRGTFYSMDLNDEGFNFVALGRHGATQDRVHVRFSDLKAVFQVRDLRGNRRHLPRYATPSVNDPDEAAVYFTDGEVIRGHITGHWGPHDPRFYLVPRDADDNNVLVIVESSAVERVEVQGRRRTRELRDLISNAVRKRLLVYYWRHRGRTVTAAEIARRIDRVEAAVAQNLLPFIEHGLVERRTEGGSEVFSLKDPSDRATRRFLKTTCDEIAHLYFRGEARRRPQAGRV